MRSMPEPGHGPGGRSGTARISRWLRKAISAAPRAKAGWPGRARMISSMNSLRASQSKSAIRPNTEGERGKSSSTKPQTVARRRGSLRSARAMPRATGPPPTIRVRRDSLSRRRTLHAICLSRRTSTSAARLPPNILEAPRGLIPWPAAMKTSPIANKVDLVRAGMIPAGDGSPARV